MECQMLSMQSDQFYFGVHPSQLKVSKGFGCLLGIAKLSRY